MPPSRASYLSASVACAVAAALSACAPSYRVRVYEPGFTGVRATVMEGNVLASGSLFGAEDVELNLERIDSLRTPPHFALRVRLRTDGPEIHRSEPLTLLIDGDSLRLPRDSTDRPRPRYDEVRADEARYPIAALALRRMAGAAEVRVLLRVGSWLEERRLYPRNIENVRRFLDAQLPTDSAAAAADSALAAPRVPAAPPEGGARPVR